MLWALTALIIPVLIHLLQLRRYKEVKFSNVSFLEEVNKEAKSHQRLKNILILLTRLIAIGALILAFADPFIPFDESDSSIQSRNVVGIYIDNSPSMQAIGENGDLLQTAKANALEIAEQYSETDRYHIITNDFNGSDSRFVTKEECLEKIAGIKESTVARNVEAVVSRASDHVEKTAGMNKILYYLSDLQRSTHDLGSDFVPDTGLAVHFIPSFANVRPNIWIDSAWFSSPIATTGKLAQLNVRMRHNAVSEVEGLNMRLDVNGVRKAVGTYNVRPGLETDTVMKFSFENPGDYHAEISIDDSPISFDNNYFLGFEVVDKIRVLQISQDPNSQESARVVSVCKSNSDALEIESVKTLPDEVQLQDYDLVISNGLSSPSNGYSNSLKKFAENGGAVLVIPDTVDFNTRAELLVNGLGFGDDFSWDSTREPTSISSLNVEHPHFDGVFSSTPAKMDLPKSKLALKYRPHPEVQRLGSNWNGENFLAKSRVGSGSAFLLGMPLDEELGNLTSHALFVPIVLRMAETARQSELLAITLGGGNAISMRDDLDQESEIRVINSDSSISIIPEVRKIGGSTRLMLGPALTEPGNYTVLADGENVATLGVNANRIESDPESWDVPSYRNELEKSGWNKASVLEVSQTNLATIINNIESGKHLWWYLVLVVLLALTGETLLQKRWKATS